MDAGEAASSAVFDAATVTSETLVDAGEAASSAVLDAATVTTETLVDAGEAASSAVLDAATVTTETIADAGEAASAAVFDVANATSETMVAASETLAYAGDSASSAVFDVAAATGETLADAGEAASSAVLDAANATSERIVAAGATLADAGEAMGEAMGTIWGDEDDDEQRASEPGAATTHAMVCDRKMRERQASYADDEDGVSDDDAAVLSSSGRVGHPAPHHPPPPPLSAVRDRRSSTAIAVVHVEGETPPLLKRKSKTMGEYEVSSGEASPQRSSSGRFHLNDNDAAALCYSRKWTEDGDDVLEQLVESSHRKRFRTHEDFNELTLDEDTTDAAPMHDAAAADARDVDGLVDTGVNAKRSDSGHQRVLSRFDRVAATVGKVITGGRTPAARLWRGVSGQHAAAAQRLPALRAQSPGGYMVSGLTPRVANGLELSDSAPSCSGASAPQALLAPPVAPPVPVASSLALEPLAPSPAAQSAMEEAMEEEDPIDLDLAAEGDVFSVARQDTGTTSTSAAVAVPESLGAFCFEWELNKARSDDTSEHLKASPWIHCLVQVESECPSG